MLRSGSVFALSRSLRVLLPLGATVLAASALLAYDAVSSRSPAVSVAGEAKMQMLRDEHALIAEYVASTNEARKLADAATDRDIARMRLAAAEETKAEPKTEPKTATMHTPERAPAVRVAGRDMIAAEPLPLVQATNGAVTQSARPVQVRYSDGPVRSRLRQLATDVRSLPSWLSSAAHWVVDAVPSPKLPSLPVRQFRAEI